MNAHTTISGLASVVAPYGVKAERPPRRIVLIDTENEPMDALRLGLGGCVPVDEKDGLRVVLTIHPDGFQVLTTTTCEGETEVCGPAVAVLTRELRAQTQEAA